VDWSLWPKLQGPLAHLTSHYKDFVPKLLFKQYIKAKGWGYAMHLVVFCPPRPPILHQILTQIVHYEPKWVRWFLRRVTGPVRQADGHPVRLCSDSVLDLYLEGRAAVLYESRSVTPGILTDVLRRFVAVCSFCSHRRDSSLNGPKTLSSNLSSTVPLAIHPVAPQNKSHKSQHLSGLVCRSDMHCVTKETRADCFRKSLCASLQTFRQ